MMEEWKNGVRKKGEGWDRVRKEGERRDEVRELARKEGSME